MYGNTSTSELEIVFRYAIEDVHFQPFVIKLF